MQPDEKKYADPFDLDEFMKKFATGLEEDEATHAALPKVHKPGEFIEDNPDDSHLEPLDVPMRPRSNGRGGYAR